MQTSLFSINRHGQIAGGFLDKAGATASSAFDINDRRQIVGAFERPTGDSPSTPPQSIACGTDRLLGSP